MLSNDPPAVRGRACLVAGDSGGVKQSLRELTEAGWRVHVLWCGTGDPAGVPQFRDSEVEVTELHAVTLPADALVPELYGGGPAEQSDLVRHALAMLQTECDFGLIEFGTRGGLAARTVQAKRAGLGFENVAITVRLDGTSQRDRESQERWPADFAEVERDYLERAGFEECDVQCIPDVGLAKDVRRNGWAVRPDAVTSAAGYPAACPALHVARSHTPLVTIGIAHHNLGRYLPDTLATLAAQTYPNLEVIVIDDGSTDADSLAVFEELKTKYSSYQFHRQANAGIGTTRNRCIELATGDYFVPVDADNLARPEMIERFVTAMFRNPDYSAMSCYFLAFDEDVPGRRPQNYIHALRPTGGPHALAGIRNVYGDANAIFRTVALRAVGGYGTDRGTSCEDWELFVKMVHAGHRIGVIPDHLFYYRHRPGGFSRSTNWFANHQRVLRQFATPGALPPAEALALWTALLGFHQRNQELSQMPSPRRHRIADGLYSALTRPLGWLRRTGRPPPNPESPCHLTCRSSSCAGDSGRA